MARTPQRSPIGDAMVWAARIMAVGLVMFLPAVAGTRLDGLFGTTFLGICGLAVGFAAGLAWLVQCGRRRPS